MIEREVLDRNEILVGQKLELRSKSGCGVVIYKMNNTSLKIERIIKQLSNAIAADGGNYSKINISLTKSIGKSRVQTSLQEREEIYFI